MPHTIAFGQWLLLIIAAVGIASFIGYTEEVARGKITRFTRWSELTKIQAVFAWCTIGSVLSFILTLIALAMVKGM